MMSVQHISIDSIRDYIDQLESAWKYAAINYHIETANNPVSYETEKANQYAITLIKMHDLLMPLDRDTIERIILEIEGQIIGQSDKQRKTDLKAVRTITEDFLNIDSWGEVKQ